MIRTFVGLALAASLAPGCAFDKHRGDRPARLRIGANVRDLGTATPAGTVALRETRPTQPQPEAATEARTGVAQFTMSLWNVFYTGGEVEAGTLDTSGSNFAGAYGVFGMEHLIGPVHTGVEVAAGWRGLRDELGASERSSVVAEPRLHGHVPIGEFFTLGASVGTTLAERGAWMFGIELGFHSLTTAQRRGR